MGVRMLLGAVISAAVLLVWSVLFWMVLSAPGKAVRAVPDETALMQSMREAVPGAGAYYFPMPPGPGPGAERASVVEAFRRRHVHGPVGLLLINPEGSDPLSPRTYLLAFGHALLASLVAALLLRIALPVLESYLARALFVFLLGVFAAVAVQLSDPIWWRLPWSHHLHGAAYHVLTWLLGGLVLAAVVKPRRGAVHVTDPRQPLWKRALDVD